MLLLCHSSSGTIRINCFLLADVFAVVTYDGAEDCYRLWVYSEESVPAYGPALPRPNVFHNAQQFRMFLLTKCMFFREVLVCHN